MTAGTGVRRHPLVPAVVLLAAGVGLGLLLRAQGLQNAANWAQLVSVPLAIASLLLQRQAPAVVGTLDQVSHAQRKLANLVLVQWEDEIRLRQLDNPGTLGVRWRLADEPALAGRTDRIDELAATFRGHASRRMVVVGEPGMGKTSLAVLLVRELVASQADGDPVPVLLSLSSWHPAQPLHDWLTRRIAKEYPALGAAELGGDAVRRLIAEHRVLPVLDGLDELPEALRPAALTALNEAMTRDDQLILTCRRDEYETAVAEGGDIARAIVIEPLPLTTSDVVGYLTDCLRNRSDRSWATLLAALDDIPASPLASALATPLDLWLLRKIYIDARSDPAELLDSARFPTSAAITRHLLDHLPDALIRADQAQSGGDKAGWDPADVKRWLAFLARHLDSTDDRDLAWWRLHRAVDTGPRYRAGIGLAWGLGFGLLTGLVGGLYGLLFDAPAVGLVVGLVTGFGTGLGYAMAAGHHAEPAYANLRLRGRGRLLLTSTAQPMVLWVASGLGIGTLFQFVLGVDFWSFVLIGAVFGLLHGLMVWIATLATDDRAQSPVSTLRADLQLVSIRTLGFGVVGGLVIGLVTDLVGYPALLGSLVLVALIVVLQDRDVPPALASLVYVSAVCVLRLRRRTPFRLMRFLDGAHRLGLLRRAGRVYQFRHANLQEHLAESDDGPAPDSASS
ncbi:NACHT domain-containing protein [Saccharopolyspora sp. 5N708]|uniref:NACHT domain-containing protein n=1 Tax=Saccharopolyspora sp. 5N708 TaxID=3457424 RepID=UPI003FD352AC